MNVQKIIDSVIKREGGYVNDPTDFGGETRFGISKRSYPELDIAKLTIENAIFIYEHDYWHPSKVSELPESLQEIYFDMVVNMGQGNAVNVLQQASGVVVDGRIGKKTIKASKKLEPDRLRAFRILHYARIVIKHNEQMRFYYGWFKRGIEV